MRALTETPLAASDLARVVGECCATSRESSAAVPQAIARSFDVLAKRQ